MLRIIEWNQITQPGGLLTHIHSSCVSDFTKQDWEGEQEYGPFVFIHFWFSKREMTVVRKDVHFSIGRNPFIRILLISGQVSCESFTVRRLGSSSVWKIPSIYFDNLSLFVPWTRYRSPSGSGPEVQANNIALFLHDIQMDLYRFSFHDTWYMLV